MKERVIAKRYGKAVFDLALELGDVAGFAKDIGNLRAVAEEEASFVKGLSDNRIDIRKRLVVADRISDVLALNKETKAFLRILVMRNRVGLLSLIALDFAQRVEKYESLKVARASVAHSSFAQEVRQGIEEAIKTVLGCNARCETEEDMSLMGGFLVRLGDVCYDASVKGKLARMRERLYGNSR